MNARNSTLTESGGGAERSESKQRMDKDAQAAIETAKQDLADVGAKVADDAKALAGEAKRQASRAVEQASAEAMGFVEQQKEMLSGRIDRVADVARKVADQLETEDATAARAAKMVANSVSDLGRNLRERDMDQLVSMAASFGRRQPATFLAAAALAGFAASRFLKASAARARRGGDEFDAPGPKPRDSAVGAASLGSATIPRPQSGGNAMTGASDELR